MKFKEKKNTRNLPVINTTALPDIIFMLLFFFMVTTVMQPASTIEELVLPNVITQESCSKTKTDELVIFLFPQNKVNTTIAIDNNYYLITDAHKVISQKILRMKNMQLFPSKALLRIDRYTKMSAVNQVKEVLQKNEVLNVEYVHMKTGQKN